MKDINEEPDEEVHRKCPEPVGATVLWSGVHCPLDVWMGSPTRGSPNPNLSFRGCYRGLIM